MLSDTEQIKRVLHALGEKMTFRHCEPIGLVVCGGAALNVAEVISRPTRDVDIVALVEVAIFDSEGTIKLLRAPKELPEDMQICAREVAKDFRLPSSWLNVGPRELFDKKLPSGIEGRLKAERFGSSLGVYWLGRQDLICLKMYAASDVHGRRQDQHYDDLAELKPTFEEAEMAIEWMRTLKGYDELSVALKDVLKSMELDDLAYYA